jgi:hypothetical protein
MTSFACPTCGGEVRFNSGTPFAVCRYCKSLLTRNDVTLESVGQAAMVPDDFSPLQIGVMGRYEGRRFTVVGRLRKVWAEGSWNEWCVAFEDGHFGWLAEAQGELVMTFEQPVAVLGSPVRKTDDIQPGAAWRIGGNLFSVTDIKDVSCLGAEGELTGVIRSGESVRSVDLRGPGFEFATVEFRAAKVTPFVGRFVEFADCRFSNLRRLAGWDAPQDR